MLHLEKRRRVAEAAARIEQALSREVEYADPRVAAAFSRWASLTETIRNVQIELAKAEAELETAIAIRRDEALADDRKIILDASMTEPRALVVEHDGERMPARCLVTGLAMLEGDELVGDVEMGAVLKAAVQARPSVARALFGYYAGELMPALMLTAAAMWGAFASLPVTPFVIVGLSA